MQQRRPMPRKPGLFGGFHFPGSAKPRMQTHQQQRPPANVFQQRNRFSGNQNRPGLGSRMQQAMQRIRSYGSSEGVRQKSPNPVNHAETELKIRTRENIKLEINELKKLCDDNLRGNQDRELSGIYMIVLEGIEHGQIRGSRDIEFYFREWFKDILEKDPSFAQHPMLQKFKNPEQAINYHSNRAARKFMESFSAKYERPKLYGIFNRLAQIAVGQDPHE